MALKIGLLRRGEDRIDFKRVGLFVALVTLAIAAADLWFVWTHRHSTLWLANGVVVAALVLLRRRAALCVLAASFLISLGFNFVLGLSLEAGVGFSAIDVGEVLAVAVLARRLCGARVDLVSPRRLAGFALSAAAPTALAAVIDVLCTPHGQLTFKSWSTWFASDLLGLLIGAPCVLLMARRARYEVLFPASRLERAAILAGAVAATVAGLADSLYGMASAILPVALIAAVRLGPSWAAMALFAATITATTMSALRLGAFGGPGGWGADSWTLGGMERLQIVCTLLIVSLLPTANMIARHRADRRRLTRRDVLLRKAKRDAEAAAEAKGRFLANMSHELRTPLTAMIGYADLLGRNPSRAAARAYTASLRSAGDALTALVNDILDLAKIEAGKLELSAEPFAVRELIAGSARILQPAADRAGLEVRLDLEIPETLWAMGDAQRIRQILLNLLSNAVKFTAQGGVAVAARILGDEADRRLRVEVADTGVGIAPEGLARLFQRFSQGDASTTRQFGGTGLGLAISKQLVERMDGVIGATSELGRGSCFWFEIALPPAEPALAAAADDDAAEADTLAGLKVLIAEDTQANRELLRSILTAFGVEMVFVGDGAQAVEAVQAQAFDLVLMDVQMPVMDGVEATRRIRALPGPAAGVPIIAMSANVLDDQVASYRRAGMDDHVPKPFLIADLWAAIARRRRGSLEEAAAAAKDRERLART